MWRGNGGGEKYEGMVERGRLGMERRGGGLGMVGSGEVRDGGKRGGYGWRKGESLG